MKMPLMTDAHPDSAAPRKAGWSSPGQPEVSPTHLPPSSTSSGLITCWKYGEFRPSPVFGTQDAFPVSRIPGLGVESAHAQEL
jgi:hypothetical protein